MIFYPNMIKVKYFLMPNKFWQNIMQKEIIIKEDGVYLGSGSANEPAVLGNQLATLLVDWLGALSQMMTPTMMGPQPPANLAKFVSLQAKS